jgi:hypothetical protein
MKIRNRHLIRAAGWLGTRAAFALVRTLRFEYRCLGPVVAPITAVPPESRYLYVSWHENLLVPAVKFGHPDIGVLISRHADGQLLGSLITAVGMGMVLGSTNRGGVEAVRQLVHGTAGRRHLIVTPDGPRGPRRVAQPGVVYVASRAGMQLVPVGVGFDRPWRAGSWDRFAVPKPCSRARVIFGEPMAVPLKVRADGLEAWRLAVQHEMDRLNAAAERWAETNRFELPSSQAPAVRLAS